MCCEAAREYQKQAAVTMAAGIGLALSQEKNAIKKFLEDTEE